MKKLLMLGLLMGAFYAGTLYDQQFLHLKNTIIVWGATLRDALHTVREAWNTYGTP